MSRARPASARQRVLNALALAPLDPPTLGSLLSLSSTTIYRSLEELEAQGAATRSGHAPRRRRGGLRAVQWRLAERA